MSPEQAKGNTKFVGPPADIYALRVILYECLAGVRPFQDSDTHVLLRRVIEDEAVRPSKHVSGLPRDLELIALKCLAKDPADRYATAKSLAEDLVRFSAGERVSVRPAGTIERTRGTPNVCLRCRGARTGRALQPQVVTAWCELGMPGAGTNASPLASKFGLVLSNQIQPAGRALPYFWNPIWLAFPGLFGG